MTLERRKPTEERPWPHCEGGLWKCSSCGLNWCTKCNARCDECGELRPAPEGMPSDELLSSKEMARRAGVTFRRLDLWVQTGQVTPMINPGGTGRPRRWHPSQIGEVVEVRERMTR